MKEREMTNEALARCLETMTFNYDVPLREAMHEAAARLRRPIPVDDDLLKMARDIDAKNAEIAKLRTLTTHTDNSEVIAELERRLKVAEDAVVSMRKVFGHTGDTDAISMCDYALAAIHAKGGEDGK